MTKTTILTFKFFYTLLFLKIILTSSSPITLNIKLVPSQKSINKPNSINKHIQSFVELPKLDLDYNNNDQSIKTTIALGFQSNTFDLEIDMNSILTWVPHVNNNQPLLTKFNPSSSSSCQVLTDPEEFTYEDGRKIVGYTLKDTLYFGASTRIQNFHFIGVTDSLSFDQVNGRLSFGLSQRTASDEQFCIMSYLVQQNAIAHKVIVIEFTDGNNGTFSIGKLPSKAIDNYRQYGRCNLVNDHAEKGNIRRNWLCLIDGILLGHNPQSDKFINFNNVKIKFDYTSSRTLIPIEKLLLIEKYYFADKITSGECNFGIKNNYYSFTCLNNNYNDLNDISLILGKWLINIPKNKLFIHDIAENEYEFILHSKEGYDNAALGTSIMKDLIMVFDEYNGNVGFYSDTQVSNLSGEVEPPKRFDNGEKPPSQSPIIPDPKIEENPNKPKPFVPFPVEERVPTSRSSFFKKFFKAIGIILLIACILFVCMIIFRYFRRKRFADSSFYYSVSNKIFRDGTPIE